jgi:hypothetical protein
MGLSIFAAGTTSVQMAVYGNDASPVGVAPHRPGTFIGASNQAQTTTGQPLATFSGVSLSANTLYWICHHAGDTTTLRYQTLPTAAGGTQSVYLNLVGASLVQNKGQGGAAPINGVAVTVNAYGTAWPTSLHGASMAETTQTPWFSFEFASIP